MSFFVALTQATTAFQLGGSVLRPSPPAALFVQMAWPMPGKGGAKKWTGEKVVLDMAPAGMEWARAAWATADGEPSAGSCYMIDGSATPDESKDYFFCSEPAADAR